MKTRAALAFYSILLFSGALGSGCSPTKAFDAKKAEGIKTATVTFYSHKCSLTEMSVDGVSPGWLATGVDVLPGTHPIKLRYQLAEQSCNKAGAFCEHYVYDGECTGQITTGAGGNYRIEVTASGQQAKIAFKDNMNRPGAGTGFCKIVNIDTSLTPK